MPAPIDHTMLALTLNEAPVGRMFDKVPAHVTLLPWIDIRSKREEALELARQAINRTPVFAVDAGEVVCLGNSESPEYAQLLKSETLRKLHRELYAGVVSLGLACKNSEWFDEAYVPHSTALAEHPLEEGSLVYFGEVAVIDNVSSVERQNGGRKLVSETIRLGVL